MKVDNDFWLKFELGGYNFRFKLNRWTESKEGLFFELSKLDLKNESDMFNFLSDHVKDSILEDCFKFYSKEPELSTETGQLINKLKIRTDYDPFNKEAAKKQFFQGFYLSVDELVKLTYFYSGFVTEYIGEFEKLNKKFAEQIEKLELSNSSEKVKQGKRDALLQEQDQAKVDLKKDLKEKYEMNGN